MILESILPCAYLLLTSGSCSYFLIKHCCNKHGTLLPYAVSACLGFTLIWMRSFGVLTYRLFFKTYILNPELLESEEEDNELKMNILDQLSDTTSMASIVWSLYSYHGYYAIGTSIVIGIVSNDIFQLKRAIAISSQEEVPAWNILFSNVKRSPNENREIDDILWFFSAGFFAWAVGNSYGLVANFTCGVTMMAMRPESFYQGWTINQTISDYTMMAYIVLMTAAFL